MPLPHPHGDASGEIGHQANYDTGDTPTSTGGKFIGFGEEGTSAVANRAHWALSENIDYLHTKITQDIAVPKRYDRTSAGESSFQFPADGEEIWVGDDTYPGSAGTSDAEGMQMLFNIVDSNYNELTDTFDNEIRVKLVRESTNVTDVYQGGFESQPYIHFVAVDPTTGVVVTDPYTIPAATEYKIVCGIKGSIAELPSDAFMRFKAQSSSELEAGVFLQDGSRALLGDLDVNGNNVVNPLIVEGKAGEDLQLYAKTNLTFRDQNITTPVPFGETGQDALYKPTLSSTLHTGVLGALNAITEGREASEGNRCLDRTGDITTSDDEVTYPALKVLLQGQVVDIAGGTVAAPDDGVNYLYVEPDGTVRIEEETGWNGGNPEAGSVLIWKGTLASLVWSSTYDLRWPGTRRGDHTVVYVGSGIGADFTSLNQAVDWLNEHELGPEKINTVKEIVVVGEAEVTSTVTLPAGTTLRGVSRGDVIGYTYSTIKTSTDFDDESHVIYANHGCVIRNLDLRWNHATLAQNVAYAGLYMVSPGSSVTDVNFDGVSTRMFANCIMTNPSSRSGLIVRNCVFNGFSNAAIKAVARQRIHIENCTFFSDAAGAPTYHIDLDSSGTSTNSSNPSNTIVGCYFSGARPTTAHIRVCGPGVLIDSCHCVMTGAAASSFLLVAEDGVDSQSGAGAVLRNCVLEGGDSAVSCAISNANLALSLFVENCVFTDFTGVVVALDCVTLDPASQIAVDGNNFIGGGTTETAIRVRADNVRISGNKFHECTLYCVHLDPNGADINNVQIANNLFQSCCSKTVEISGTPNATDVQACVVYLEVGATYGVDNLIISDNIFRSILGSAVRTVAASGKKNAVISDNIFDYVEGRFIQTGPDMTQYGVLALLSGGDWSISGNKFYNCGAAYTNEDYIINAHAIYVNNTVTSLPVTISNNTFKQSISSNQHQTVDDTWYDIGIYADGDVICTANSHFMDMDASESKSPNGVTADATVPAYAQIYKSGTSDGVLVLTGCLFRLLGAADQAFTGGYSCVRSKGGTVVASACYTRGTWTRSGLTSNYQWDLRSSVRSHVVGCVFEGDNDIDIASTNGFCVGNTNYGAAGTFNYDSLVGVDADWNKVV